MNIRSQQAVGGVKMVVRAAGAVDVEKGMFFLLKKRWGSNLGLQMYICVLGDKWTSPLPQIVRAPDPTSSDVCPYSRDNSGDSRGSIKPIGLKDESLHDRF